MQVKYKKNLVVNYEEGDNPQFSHSISLLKRKIQDQKIISPILFEEKMKKDILPQHLDKTKNPAFTYSIEIRTSQNQNLKLPSIRKDVGFLDKWLKEMIDMVSQDHNYSFNALIEDLQLVYSACLKELIRQISLHCVERGQLLEKIWNCYLDLLEKAISSNKTEKNKMEREFLSEIARIFDIFEKEANNYKEELRILSKENLSLKEKNKNHWEELLYLRTKHHRFEKENRGLRDHTEMLLMELQSMAKELYNYKIFDEAAFDDKGKKKMNTKYNNIDKNFQEIIEKNAINYSLAIGNEERVVEEKGVNTEDLDEVESETISQLCGDEQKNGEFILQNMEESVAIVKPKQQQKKKKEKKIKEKKSNFTVKNEPIIFSEKAVQVDLFDGSPSPLLRGSTVLFEEPPASPVKEMEILDEKEKLAVSTLKSYDKMAKSVLLSQNNLKVLDIKNNEKILGLMELGKSNLIENLDLKRELLVLKEEINHFTRENKKLRYTYQKNLSELEENKQKNFNMNEDLKIIEKKVCV